LTHVLANIDSSFPKVKGLPLFKRSRGASAEERIAEEVVTAMMLKRVVNVNDCIIHRERSEERNGIRYSTHSCASKTSPVIAEKPRKGASGSESPFTWKQSDQSSPAKRLVHILTTLRIAVTYTLCIVF
jgi:hypothetical protein